MDIRHPSAERPFAEPRPTKEQKRKGLLRPGKDLKLSVSTKRMRLG